MKRVNGVRAVREQSGQHNAVTSQQRIAGLSDGRLARNGRTSSRHPLKTVSLRPLAPAATPRTHTLGRSARTSGGVGITEGTRHNVSLISC